MRSRRFLLVVVATASCGRRGFDAVGDAGMTGDARDTALDTPSAPIGCADGEREAFGDRDAFPAIAGCAATWPGMLDLRLPRTGAACGDDLATCAVLADACEDGWHVCAASGDVSELAAVGPDACATAGIGRYAAAANHCIEASPACTYPAAGAFPCTVTGGVCTEPLCCGNGCITAGCPDALWFGSTMQTTAASSGCGSHLAADSDGVLCCRDFP